MEQTNQHHQDDAPSSLAAPLVAGAIASRTSPPHLPEFIRTFLQQSWSKVLATVYERDGHGSPAWEAAVAVADDLVWSVKPKRSTEDRRAMAAKLPGLLMGLQEGLALILFEHEQQRRFLSQLERVHLACLRGRSWIRPRHPRRTAGGVLAAPVDEIVLASPAHYDFDKELESDDPDAKLVRTMPVGTWIAFLAEDGEPVRGKLAWRTEPEGDYTFLDRSLNIVAERSFNELVEDFYNGRAELMEHVPFLDRALDAMWNALAR